MVADDKAEEGKSRKSNAINNRTSNAINNRINNCGAAGGSSQCSSRPVRVPQRVIRVGYGRKGRNMSS